MYKRKAKLGIVRSFSKPQDASDKLENISPNLQNVHAVHQKLVPDETHSKFSVMDDPDEVLSDSEPSPKKSRRFCSSSSTIMKDSSRISNLNESHRPILVKKATPNKLQSLDTKRSGDNLMESGSPRVQLNKNSSQKSQISKGRPTGDIVKEKNIYTGNGKNKQSYLEELFEKAGLSLSNGYSPNVLNTDQAIFIRDISTVISSNEKEIERHVEHIMRDLEEYCGDDKCLKFAVSCTETASDCDVSRGATQDSLMRLLLHVDCLQVPITELLMDKLAKFVMDGPGDNTDIAVITWVRMIIQCFRFIDRMTNGSLVNERLLDIVLATSDVTIQQEVITSLPDIIGDTEHHHAALELSKIVRKNNPHLLASALEALMNLSLQPDVRAQIQPILMKALSKVKPEFLPTILKFLFTDCDVPLMDEMVTYIRNELDLSEIPGDTASIQVLVFSTLRDALLASRTLSGIWQKNISSVKPQAGQNRPIDILMLLVLLSTTNDPVRHRSIEAVFRNRIRFDMFTEPLIDETLKYYIAVVKEYFHVATKLAGALLKSTEPTVIGFASKMYIGMFVNMDGLWCKWVLSDLQVCVGAGDVTVARAALNILQHLTKNHHDRVKPLGVVLMLLLNKLNDLALSDVCQLMDILCQIAYSQEDTTLSDSSILQEEINILVQKQLASSQLSILRSGVVGCVMTVKHIASIPEDKYESCASEAEETSEKAKKAIQLLELLLSSTRSSTEAHGLALDQLSHLLISDTTLDPSFIKMLSSLMRDTLQDIYLIAASDFEPKDEVLKSSLQFCLDEDVEGSIALNLCELVASESGSAKSASMMAVSCLHPLLRLLRGLEIRDLSEIDALLGCAIAMPVPAVYTDFSQLTVYQQHVALHCLFHCINWLYEIINCFSYLVKKAEPEKVLVRVRTVVWLRSVLARCLSHTVEYTPPMCHFQALPKPKLSTSEKTAKKKKNGKKKRKKTQENEENVLSGNENTCQVDDEEEEPVEEKTADLSKYKHYFRELDIDMWLILMQPLVLSPTPEKDGMFTPELGPKELLFVLDDYVTKVSRVLTSSNKRVSFLKTAVSHNIGFENLDKFPAWHVAKNTIKLLSYLCCFLEKTVEYTQNLIKVNDGILDSTGMFMEGSADIKQCQGKLLKILAILFSWVGFQSLGNENYLIAALQKVAARSSSEQSKNKSKKLLVRECVQYFSQSHEHVLDLTSACTLVDVLKALAHHADNDASINAEIAKICLHFLGRRWYDLLGNREKGAVLNNQLNELLAGYFSHTEDQMTAVTKISTWLTSESQQLTDKDSSLTTFPSFSRLNLYLVIGGVLKGLEGAVRQKVEAQLSDREQLEVWSSFTLCLESLVTVIKANDSKPNLRVFMKGCTIVLKLFLSHGMSTCTFMFKHEPATVSQILKKLQVTTRYIQTVCNFVKVSKDTGLTQFLPPIRAVMETIILRVKSIIVINNCTDAFFMGSMKNRDLKGQEIMSQEIQAEDEEEEEDVRNESDLEAEEEDKNSLNLSDEGETEETNESVSI